MKDAGGEIVHLHCCPNHVQRFIGEAARSPASFEQNIIGVAGQLTHRPARPDRIEKRIERVNKLSLYLNVADLAKPVTALEIFYLFFVRVEGIMVDEDRI